MLYVSRAKVVCWKETEYCARKGCWLKFGESRKQGRGLFSYCIKDNRDSLSVLEKNKEAICLKLCLTLVLVTD